MYNLEASEDNLNSNPTNSQLAANFVHFGTIARDDLMARYTDGTWVDPATLANTTYIGYVNQGKSLAAM